MDLRTFMEQRFGPLDSGAGGVAQPPNVPSLREYLQRRIPELDPIGPTDEGLVPDDVEAGFKGVGTAIGSMLTPWSGASIFSPVQEAPAPNAYGQALRGMGEPLGVGNAAETAGSFLQGAGEFGREGVQSFIETGAGALGGGAVGTAVGLAPGAVAGTVAGAAVGSGAGEILRLAGQHRVAEMQRRQRAADDADARGLQTPEEPIDPGMGYGLSNLDGWDYAQAGVAGGTAGLGTGLGAAFNRQALSTVLDGAKHLAPDALSALTKRSAITSGAKQVAADLAMSPAEASVALYNQYEDLAPEQQAAYQEQAPSELMKQMGLTSLMSLGGQAAGARSTMRHFNDATGGLKHIMEQNPRAAELVHPTQEPAQIEQKEPALTIGQDLGVSDLPAPTVMRRVFDFVDRDGKRERDRLKAESDALREQSSDHERRAMTAERDAEVDDLTGLPNAKAWFKAREAAEADPALSIVSADADNVKRINDAGGHSAGDDALRKAAQAMVAAAQDNPNVRVFRKGGDEFSAILPKEMAEQYRDAVEAFRLDDDADMPHQDRMGITAGFADSFDGADLQLSQRKAMRKGLTDEQYLSQRKDREAAEEASRQAQPEQPAVEAQPALESGVVDLEGQAVDAEPQQAQSASYLNKHPIEYADPKGLKLSTEVPNFKRNASKKTGEVAGQELQGDWDDRGLSPIQTWVRNDGREEVISGRHRRAHAERNNIPEIPVQRFYEKDGFTAQDARSLDSELNIRDGMGTDEDFVTYFRERKPTEDEARTKGMLRYERGKRAYTIASDGNQNVYDAFINGKVEAKVAETIARSAPKNDRLQDFALQYLDNNPDAGPAEIADLIAEMDFLGTRPGAVQDDLLGGVDTSGGSDFKRSREVAEAERLQITKEINAISGAANNPDIAKKHGFKTPNDAKKRLTQLRQEEARWKGWRTDPEMRAKVREKAGLTPDSQPEPKPDPEPEPEPEDRFTDTATDSMFGDETFEGSPTPEPEVSKAPEPSEAPKADDAPKKRKSKNRAFKDDAYQAALKRQTKRASGEQMMAGLDPGALKDAFIIGGYHFESGLRTFGEWSGRMLDVFGDAVKPHLEELWGRVKNAVQSHNENEPDLIGDESATSIKNATVDQEREKRGLKPAMEPARRSFGRVWDDAMAIIEKNSRAQDALISDLQAKPRALTDTEDALLLHRQVELQNQHDQAAADLVKAYESGPGDELASAKNRMDAISGDLQALYDVNKAVGTETGRGLNARKMLAKEDFTLAAMRTKKRAEKGGQPLSPDEETEVKNQHDKIVAAQKAIDGHQKALDEKQREQALDEFIKRERELAKRESDVTTREREFANEVFSGKVKRTPEKKLFSDEGFEAAKRRMMQRSTRLNMATGLDPEAFADALYMAGYVVERGVYKFADFSKQMVQHVGEFIKPHLDDLWKKVAPDEDGNAKAGTDPILDGMKARINDGDSITDLSRWIQKMAKDFIRSGITNREELVDAVHAQIKAIDPEFTRRQTMDAISGYGAFSPLSKDTVSAQLRDLKGQMQQVSKLQDIESGHAPLKTGVERRTPSDEERRLIKLVEDAKRRNNIVVTDPEKQLKSSLDATKTRLKNQIVDLEYQIVEKSKIVKSKTPPKTDAEADALKGRRDELKKQFDEVFGKEEMTDEQRVALATRAVERSIADLERRVKNGELEAKNRGSSVPETPELSAARARRGALKAELDELRAADAGIQEAKYTKSLESSIADYERRIEGKDFATAAGPKNKADTALLRGLRERREQVRKEFEALRKDSPENQSKRLTAAAESIQKSITDLQDRIQAGDLAQKKKEPGLSSPALDFLREERKSLEKVLRDLRKAAEPVKSPEEVAMAALKARLKHQTAALMEKVANGDFTQKKRRFIEPDKEATKLLYEYDKAKREWYEGVIKTRLAQRSTGKIIFDTAGEIANTARAILTSMDLSAVLRQGGFIAIGNPLLAAKSIGPMFRVLRSESGQFAVEEEIRQRPNYSLYQRSKLHLSEHGAASLIKMEEAYMSRWAEKIPGVAASARAYVTFLNKLRADSFDTLVETLSHNGTPTLEESKAIANFINVATGRGSLGKFETSAVFLNTVLFAPKYVTSRFQMLAGQPMYGGTGRTRKLIAKEYAKFLVGAGVIYGLSQMAGAEVERDTRSSDFGKVRIGNTRIDFMAGLLQSTVFLSRLASGETKKMDGSIVPLRGENVPYSGDDTATVTGRFLRTKLSPVTGAGLNLVAGSNVINEPMTPAQVGVNMVIPISFREIYVTMKEQGIPKGTILGLLSIFGAGVSTYAPKAPTPKNRPKRRNYDRDMRL